MAERDQGAQRYLRNLLTEIWDEVPSADSDGDFPFRSGTAMGFVRLLPGGPPRVRVWAVAVHGVRRTLGLLTELNDLNLAAGLVKAMWIDREVRVSADLFVAAAGAATLRLVLEQVTAAANDIGPLIAVVHGGSVPFPDGDAPGCSCDDEPPF